MAGPRLRGNFIKVLIAALPLAALAAAPAGGAPGYVVKQREGKSASTLTLTAAGLRYDASAPAGRRARSKPLLGLIVRYRDAHAFLLDPERKVFDSVSLQRVLSSYRHEVKAARASQPSERLPPKPGAAPVHGQAPTKLPAARLRRLRLTTRIGPLRARAYLLTEGRMTERLWFAAALPSPPRRIRRLLTNALGGRPAGPFGGAVKGQGGRVPLRIDQRVGKRWRTVLRTVSVRRRSVRGGILAPGRGYRERNLLGSARAPVHSAEVPGGPIRCGIVVTDPISCTIGGPLTGPVSSHPDLWALYWGTTFNDHREFVGSLNHALQNFVGDQFADPDSKGFWGPLGQYGVGKGRFLGYEIVDDNPDDSVGSWNFFDVDWLVLSHRYGSDAPNYWWKYIGHDPIFAIFVDQAQVDTAGWGGYHFWTPYEGGLLYFLMHPNLPWFIVKVPSVASIPHDRDSATYRAALDASTKRAAHEFVEAATDPYPFISWADPLKQPIWEEGEIADICSQGNTYPWGDAARVSKFGTAYATYWSNDDRACVPDSRPSATLGFPADGSTFTWKSDVTFIAQVDDIYDGQLTDSHIRWDDDRDGLGIGRGRLFKTNKLSPGLHHISAFVDNSVGGSRVAGPITVTIQILPPNVAISTPPDGSSFGADQTITFRGSAFDPQDGDLGPSATWSVDGTPVGTGANLFEHDITTLGTHTVTLSATNSGGLSSSTSIKLNIQQPTGKPSVRITAPADGSFFGPGEQITFTGSATPQGNAHVNNSGYSWSDDKDGALGTGQSITRTLSGGMCFFTAHHVTLTATDNFGRSGSDAITVNVGSLC